MFKARLKKLRKEKGLTQKKLADILHLQNTAVSKYELGERKPDQDTLIQIAKFFNVSLDFLVGNSNVRNPYEDKEKYPEANKAIQYAINVAKEKGYDISNLSKEELAEILVRSLKIDEITKGD